MDAKYYRRIHYVSGAFEDKEIPEESVAITRERTTPEWALGWYSDMVTKIEVVMVTTTVLESAERRVTQPLAGESKVR